MQKDLLRVALLISGGASTACRVITDWRAGALPIDVTCVISSRSTTKGIENVVKAGMPKDKVYLVRTKDHGGANEAFGRAIIDIFDKEGVDIFGQVGWMPTMPPNVLRQYKGFNQHPVQLDPGRPDFGGKGMHGRAAIDAVRRFTIYAKVEPVIESTIHFVDEQLDHGRIIKTLPMLFSREATTEQIQRALLPREHDNVVASLALLAKHHLDREPVLHISRRISTDYRLIRPEHFPLLEQAKQEAIANYPNG
ncbi:MAG: hypothetical protein HY422_00055 [Candidatus Komeilibacteria bacterium]|nr:hypothetical protein [Candidatus Komeilibacteria bacterium]